MGVHSDHRTDRPAESGLGMISFVIAGINSLVLVIVLFLVVFMQLRGYDAAFIGVIILPWFALCVTGIIVGMAGWLQKSTRHTFARIGVIANIALILAIVIVAPLSAPCRSTDVPPAHAQTRTHD